MMSNPRDKIRRDNFWMQRAIRTSTRFWGKTHPNPTVGCVIVKDDVQVAEGWHRGPGTPHAEVDAIQKCPKDLLPGSTCYVTLEPCNHFGRTPPCTQAIVEAGIKRVVIAVADINPAVAGGGAEILREAGVEVEMGVQTEKSLEILESWLKWITTRRPFVVMKLAMSLDGRIATCRGESKWISSEKSRRLVHRWRSRLAGIMVGAGTVEKDDPALTARLGNRILATPVRIIVDHSASLPEHMAVFNGKLPGRTCWVVPESCYSEVSGRSSSHVKVIPCPRVDSGLDLDYLLKYLGDHESIESILLEGGPTLAFSMIQQNLVDKVMIFIAPKLIGGAFAPGALGGEGFADLKNVPRLLDMKVRKIAEDVLIEGYLGKRLCLQGLSGKSEQ